MDLSNRNISLSSSSLIYFEHDRVFNNESISFFCVIDGAAKVIFRDFEGTLHKGDLFFLNHVGKCTVICPSKTLVLMVHFDYLYFLENFRDEFDRIECNSVLYPKKPYNVILKALTQLALSHTTSKEDNRFLIAQLNYNFFHLLKMEFVVPAADQLVENDKPSKQDLKLDQFKSFIAENYASPVTLQSTAEYLDYTPQYLANFLKNKLGITFNDYLTKIRMDYALNYLKFRNYDMDQISFLCGFNSAAAFTKAFTKKYFTTPEQFRSDFKKSFSNDPSNRRTSIREQAYIRDYLNSNSVSSLDPETNIDIIEDKEQFSYSFDVNHYTRLRPVWKEMINLGSAENFDGPVFREQLVFLQSDIAFHFGRVTNVISVIKTYVTDDGQYQFNFMPAFTVLDFMLSIGLTPFLDLGDKAPHLYLWDENPTTLSNEQKDHIFRLILPRFIEQCINRYGYDKVSEWQFELWMRYEDRLMDNMESPAAFLTRYEFVYHTLRSMVPDAKFGGPGFNTFTSFETLRSVLTLIHIRKIYPDFISAYIFPYVKAPFETGEPCPIFLNQNADFFKEDVKKLHKVMADCHMDQIPLYITEFSTQVISKNHFNDSMYQALFILKQYLDNWSATNVMSYWLACDTAMKYKDNNAFLFGGNGLISRHGIRKPGYHTYAFLSDVGNDLIAQGDNYIVTHSFDNNYQILLFNYAHFTPDYCNHSDRYEIRKYPEAAFEEKLPYQFDIELQGLKSGTYKIVHSLINSNVGSVFHEWGKFNYMTELSNTELKHLNNICLPEITMHKQSVDGTLSISEKVTRNEIVFIRIEFLK